jgi:hypothetical protein
MDGAGQYGDLITSDLRHLSHRPDLDCETVVVEAFRDPCRHSRGRAVFCPVTHRHSYGGYLQRKTPSLAAGT